MKDDLKALITYYTNNPSPLLVNKVFALLDGVNDADQKKVIEWILEHQPKKAGLDIITIREAMAECGVSVVQSEETPESWTCDLCGTQYQAVTVSNDFLRKKGIHDYCPKCGLAPADTKAALRSYKKSGAMPEWYNRLKKSLADTYLTPGAKPRYDRKSDEEYERDQDRKRIERMKQDARKEIANLATAKDYINF